jgi:hypothetical protein
MLLNKDTDIAVLNEVLKEAKDSFHSTEINYDILENKTLKIAGWLLLFLCGTSYVLAKSDIGTALQMSLIILVEGFIIALICLCITTKTSTYHANGIQPSHFKQQDEYYNDEKGIKLLQIDSYNEKISFNSKNNKKKGEYVNRALVITLCSIILASVVFIFTIK